MATIKPRKAKGNKARAGDAVGSTDDFPPLRLNGAVPHTNGVIAAHGAAAACVDGGLASVSAAASGQAPLTNSNNTPPNGAWTHVIASDVTRSPEAGSVVQSLQAASEHLTPSPAGQRLSPPSASLRPVNPDGASSAAREMSISLHANSCASSSSTQSGAVPPGGQAHSNGNGSPPEHTSTSERSADGARQSASRSERRQNAPRNPSNGAALARPAAAGDAGLAGASAGGGDFNKAAQPSPRAAAAVSPADSASSMLGGRQPDRGGLDAGVAPPLVKPPLRASGNVPRSALAQSADSSSLGPSEPLAAPNGTIPVTRS